MGGATMTERERKNLWQNEKYKNDPEYREKAKTASREQYKKNRKEKLAYQKEYANKNKESIKKRMKEWSGKNREHIRAYVKRKRKENPEAHATSEANKRRRASRYREAIKGQAGCEMCGYNRNTAALDFHHTDGDRKEKGVSQMVYGPRMEAEIAKCMIVCRNCHAEIHHPGKETGKGVLHVLKAG
jgi:hypothetical protein